MKTYGYVRVSTKSQNVERQIQNITRAYPDAEIVSETYTGTKIERPVFTKLLGKLEEGDVVVFDEVSRFGRCAEEAVGLYEELFSKGIDLVFLKEPYVSTSVYKQKMTAQLQAVEVKTGSKATDKFVSSIFDALNQYTIDLAKEQVRLAFEKAQGEVDYLHVRTKEGMRASGAGKKIADARTGQRYDTEKSRRAKELIQRKSAKFHGTLNDTDCMAVCGVSRGTYYRYVKELTKEQ